MRKIITTIVLLFVAFNSNAAISQSGITNLKQLDKNGIIDLVNGNQLIGFISDGPFEGPITQTYFKDGTYETVYENQTYKGKWRAEGESYSSVDDKKMCTKNSNASKWSCFHWYTGVKDGGTYAYVIAYGKIFHQYHEVKSVVQVNQEKKEAAEKKKKAEEAKRIDDAKKAEEKRKAEEAKRIADAKKAEEEKRIAAEKSNKKLSLIPPKTKLSSAQIFIKDLEDFVEKNPDVFDIMEVAKFKINTKLISEGNPDNDQMKTLITFREVAESSTTFLEFQKLKEEERTQIQLNKIDKTFNEFERLVGLLKSISKDNISLHSISLIDEKINSSKIEINNAKTLSEIESVNFQLAFFLNSIREEIKVNIDIKKKEEKLEKDLNSSKNNLNQNIDKLKTYLAENISSISSELMTIVVEKVNILESSKQLKFNNKQAELKALIKLNDEILSFRSKYSLLTAAEITENRKKADADAKKKADAKEAERLKNFKEIFMTCSHTIWGEYVSIQWAFDGKKVYQDGIPLNIGEKTFSGWGEEYYWFVEKLSLYKYRVSHYTIFGVEIYSVDFLEYKSKMEALGEINYANCY